MDLRNRIKAKDDKKTEAVLVPEWGETVWITTITSEDRDMYEEESLETAKGGKRKMTLRGARAKLVVKAALDEAGNKLFVPADVDWLTHKCAAAVDLLYGVAARLAGIRREDEEELEKNCDRVQSEGSGSNSAIGTASPSENSKED